MSGGRIVAAGALAAALLAAIGSVLSWLAASSLADVAPVLVVDADANVLPLTHDVAPALWLGTLAQADLRALAGDWLADGRGDALAAACARTWDELTAGWTPSFYWYDEVAARTY